MEDATLKQKSWNVKTLVRLGILTAILVVMAFTPLGYLRIGVVTPIEISLLTIPVILGAVLIGPGAGAFLGGVFGITSFIQCFGLSPFGVFLLGLNPFYTFVLCLVPRIVMGFLTGLIFKAFHAFKRTRGASYVIASTSAALLNTVLFTTVMLLFFGGNPTFVEQFKIKSLFTFLAAFIGLNGLLEAFLCLVFGFAVSRIAVAIDRRTEKTQSDRQPPQEQE